MKVTFKPATGKSYAVSISSTTASTSKPITAPVVRLVASTDCFVRIGYGAQTAVTTDMYLPAGLPEYFNLDGGDTVAAITSSASGTLYVTEMC